MEITLKTGEKIELQWNGIVLEYLEDYEGGIRQLKKDIELQENNFKTFNFAVYSMLAAVYPEEIGYREAIGLVDINDYEKIIAFIVQNVSEIEQKNNVDTLNKVKKFHRR